MKKSKPYQLISIFQNLLNEIDDLYKLLLHEADALDTRSSADLKNITKEKESIIDQINVLTQQQNSFLSQHGMSDQKDGMAASLEQMINIDPQLGELKTYWIKISDRMTKCHQLNQQNGARIELLNCHAQRSLEILKGQSNLPYTYGPTGMKQKDQSNSSTVSV